jgi:hypothetical protein
MKLNRHITHFLMSVSMLLIMSNAAAQRITLHTLVADDIRVSTIGPADLQFDCLFIGTDIVRRINLNGENSDRVIVLAIDAPFPNDVSVRVDVLDDNKLMISDSYGNSTNHGIPLELRFAYANKGYKNSNTAWQTAIHDAVETPAGSNYASFSISTGQPFFDTENTETPMERAYLFIYGSIGPAGGPDHVPAGVYETNITVSIDLMQDPSRRSRLFGNKGFFDSPEVRTNKLEGRR